MKLIRATSGKVGTIFPGPKQFLNENIRLGEVAACIARDTDNATKPALWLVGAIDLIIEYIIQTKQSDIKEVDADNLLSSLKNIQSKIPNPIERLASIFGMTEIELLEAAELAQVCISAPVTGVKNFSSGKSVWLSREKPTHQLPPQY